MKIITLIIALSLISCGGVKEPKKAEDDSSIYKTITFDSCEYVKIYDSNIQSISVGITHKGNCKFCKERNKN